VVFPGTGAHPDAGSGPGRPIVPATRVGRDLERGWFMDPSVCVALAGFRTGARPAPAALKQARGLV
jgi:hypothetical protein